MARPRVHSIADGCVFLLPISESIGQMMEEATVDMPQQIASMVNNPHLMQGLEITMSTMLQVLSLSLSLSLSPSLSLSLSLSLTLAKSL